MAPTLAQRLCPESLHVHVYAHMVWLQKPGYSKRWILCAVLFGIMSAYSDCAYALMCKVDGNSDMCYTNLILPGCKRDTDGHHMYVCLTLIWYVY
jgi:hypothetical protein